MPNFYYSEKAREDLFEILDYISLDNPDAAQRVNDAIEKTAVYLCENPGIGTVADSEYPNLRMCPIKKYGQYLLFFERTESTVLIQRIFHGARDIPEHLPD